MKFEAGALFHVNSSQKHPAKTLQAAFLVFLLFLAACANAAPTETLTPSPEASLSPTITPTPVPLGHPDNPLTIGVVGYENPAEAETAIQQLLDHLNAATGIAIAIMVLPEQTELFRALEKGDVQAAWLQPLTYIHAHNRGLAEVALLTNHFGAYFYGTQFLANVESGFTAYFDPAANQNTADLPTALSQLDGKRPCWVEPGSISGYILPVGMLEQAGIYVEPGVISQTYPAVVRSLYIKGVCDFGATFTIIGDPRTSSSVLTDLPDAVERVIVIWQTDAVIPHLNFSFSPSVDETLRRPIMTALQDFVKTDDGKQLLTQVLDGYDVQDLKIVDDSVYDPVRTALQYSSTDPSKWIGR